MSEYRIPELPSDEELGISGSPNGREGGVAPRVARGARRRSVAKDSAPAWRGPATLVALATVAWAATSARSLPDAAPANAPDTAFSSARAMVELVEIARAPRPTGSPEHARVRAHLLNRLEDIGLTPQVQTATSVVRDGTVLRAATVRNITARRTGRASTGAVLLTAHYDSRDLSPGAADDGAGVVSILEAVRALQAGPQLRNDLIVLLTDAEELGLLGARVFVERHPWMADVKVVLSVDMRGGGGPSIMFETGSENGWIVDALAAGDPRPLANSLSQDVYDRLPNDTDFTPFKEAGKQGLNFAAIARSGVYHQSIDTPARTSEATLQHHGLHLMGVVRELGERDLAVVDGPARVFFTLPGMGLVTYPRAWVVPLLVGLLLVAALVFVLVLLQVPEGRSRVAGAAVGLGLGALALAGAAGAGWGLFVWARGRHPEFGALPARAFHNEGGYVLATVAAALALVATLFGAARRRFGLGELAFGALVIPLLTTAVATVLVPMGAMNLQWPSLAALLSVALVAGTGPGESARGTTWVLSLLLALPTLAFLVPLVELLWTALSFSAAATLGALTALTLLLLLPVLDALREPNRWWAPLSALALAAALTTLESTAQPAPERPLPSTLIYALDQSSGRAWWATRPDAGLAWARARVGDFTEERPLEGFLPGLLPYRIAPAQTAEVPQLEAVRVEDTPDPAAPDGDTTGAVGPQATPPTASAPASAQATDAAGERRIRLALRSTAGAEAMAVRLPEEGGATIVAVNGRPLADLENRASSPPVMQLTHWGEPEGALVLDIQLSAGRDTLVVEVVEHHLRPGQLLDASYFRRPPDVAPNATTQSDRALILTELRVPVAPGLVSVTRPGSAGSPPDNAATVPDSVGGPGP